jgi:aspartyl-tRNA synthetase
MVENEPIDKKVYCGEVNESFVGKRITVQGWVQVKRELGGITFIDLRDREGILQIVFNQDFQDRESIKGIGRE